jgi:predicted dinucleotide-binding enzyme
MRIAFVGGTNFVGPAAVQSLVRAGHEVAVAHSGAYEHPTLSAREHLHGSRDELLARW